MNLSEADLEHLLRLRLVVARIGEMDNARWWNTKGLLSGLGGLALKRGFPKSHFLAQARVVFSTAATRCQQTFDLLGAATLWKLPAQIEERFESCWAAWAEQHERWKHFFEKLQPVQGTDLLGAMRNLAVISEDDIEEARKLRRAAGNRAVPIPGVRKASNETLTLLATGFFRGEPGRLAVPYARLEAE